MEVTRRSLTRILGGALGAIATRPAALAGQVGAVNDAVDVRSFGAKGDGRTDDTAALNAALAEAATRKISRVVLPRGTFRVSPSFRHFGDQGGCLRYAGENLIFEGAGLGKTVLDIGGYENNAAFFGLNQARGTITIRNLTFRCRPPDGSRRHGPMAVSIGSPDRDAGTGRLDQLVLEQIGFQNLAYVVHGMGCKRFLIRNCSGNIKGAWDYYGKPSGPSCEFVNIQSAQRYAWASEAIAIENCSVTMDGENDDHYVYVLGQTQSIRIQNNNFLGRSVNDNIAIDFGSLGVQIRADNVDTSRNAVRLRDHTFRTGDRIFIAADDPHRLPAGLENYGVYYLQVPDDQSIAFARTQGDAEAGKTIRLALGRYGSFSLNEWDGDLFRVRSTAVDVGGSRIDLGGPSPETGTPVLSVAGPEPGPTTSPPGLLDGAKDRYVIKTGPNTVRLATGYYQALQGNSIRINQPGSLRLFPKVRVPNFKEIVITGNRSDGSVRQRFLNLRRDAHVSTLIIRANSVADGGTGHGWMSSAWTFDQAVIENNVGRDEKGACVLDLQLSTKLVPNGDLLIRDNDFSRWQGTAKSDSAIIIRSAGNLRWSGNQLPQGVAGGRVIDALVPHDVRR